MKCCCCALLLVSAAAAGQEMAPGAVPKLELPRRNPPPGVRRFPVSGMRLKVVTAPAQRCAVPLLVVPADPNVDPKMVLKPGGQAPARMPAVKGLPPCPMR